VEKGGANVAKVTKVGFEMENEGTEVATHKRLMMLRKVGRQQTWFMIGGLHKERGMTMG
jgi:hypothetical protein